MVASQLQAISSDKSVKERKRPLIFFFIGHSYGGILVAHVSRLLVI
jgi:predicted alpha/beta superfamily hydrolase